MSNVNYMNCGRGYNIQKVNTCLSIWRIHHTVKSFMKALLYLVVAK